MPDRSKEPLASEVTSITPGAKAFYALNDLYDHLQRMSDHEVSLLLGEINERIQDSDRAGAIYEMLRAYRTRSR
jgi:hypothetical protein